MLLAPAAGVGPTAAVGCCCHGAMGASTGIEPELEGPGRPSCSRVGAFLASFFSAAGLSDSESELSEELLAEDELEFSLSDELELLELRRLGLPVVFP